MINRQAVFFEALDFDGFPRLDLDRRGRVTPRQLYAFSVAKHFGLFDPPDFLETMERGCDYLLKTVRLEDGRFAGKIGPDGMTVLAPAVLYDLAFIALAGCELTKAGIKAGEPLAEAAFDNIDERFKDEKHGGYRATETAPLKLANPHMHLLEAVICQFDQSRGAQGGARLAELLSLFEAHFYDPDQSVVNEQCEADLSASTHSWIEPGHGLEWAFLYYEAGRRLGRSQTDLVLAHNLLKAAEAQAFEIDELTLIPDRLEAGHTTRTARLWPQLERLRTVYTLEPDRDLTSILKTIRTAYLEKGPRVGWIDALDASQKPVAPHIPGSMLYHLMTAFGPLLSPDTSQ